jgi:hypothetical protein
MYVQINIPMSAGEFFLCYFFVPYKVNIPMYAGGFKQAQCKEYICWMQVKIYVPDQTSPRICNSVERSKRREKKDDRWKNRYERRVTKGRMTREMSDWGGATGDKRLETRDKRREKKDDRWENRYERLVTTINNKRQAISDNRQNSDNKWHQAATSDTNWQQATPSGNRQPGSKRQAITSGNKWQRATTSDTARDNKRQATTKSHKSAWKSG